MKKVVGNRRYDTETAAALASRSHGNPRDFGYICETLYRKRTGEFFLHGEGGAQTKYREWIDSNSWRGGEKIIPMTETEARVWAEKFLDGDQYESIFGAVEEDDDGTVKTMTYRIPVYLSDKLRKEALRRGVSQSQVLCDLIENM